MLRFGGVVPAMITPFDKANRFNESAFRELIEANILAGVDGFWLAGGSGESVLLSDEENERLAVAATDQVSGRVTTIMHIGAPTTDRAVTMAEQAAKSGVDALCCVPPFFYRVEERAIIEHYKAVGSASALPLLLYNLPQSTGVDISPALACRIRDVVPSVVGLKHSGPIVENTYGFAAAGFNCFIGYATLMLPGLNMGAVGCIDGPLTIAPELWVAIWRSVCAQDLAAAQKAQKRAAEFATAVYDIGFLDVLKAGCTMRYQVECGSPRLPQLPLTSDQRIALEGILHSFDLL